MMGEEIPHKIDPFITLEFLLHKSSAKSSGWIDPSVRKSRRKQFDRSKYKADNKLLLEWRTGGTDWSNIDCVRVLTWKHEDSETKASSQNSFDEKTFRNCRIIFLLLLVISKVRGEPHGSLEEEETRVVLALIWDGTTAAKRYIPAIAPTNCAMNSKTIIQIWNTV